jgi:eukaryotic-like serine/threonine-protein kinase
VNESAIFADAIKLATLAERAAFLDQACAGNPGLRVAVERLLDAYHRNPDFLERSANALSGTAESWTASTILAPSESLGLVIAGRYTLLEMIGEGGMGTVFRARQSEPVKRMVAVKVIKAGMDSKQVLARFEAERQALALMDHPHIARVFDGGTTTDGRPFFVMELVNGVPITRYCDDHHLTPRQRLELFVPVCHAIQHAHQKGIIHRDVKPSNVLVALYDDKPVPKVIDFGVAKATRGQLTEATLQTSVGAVVGTVEYMSPEQATFNQLDVDTRSDIYSLGVLLFELLTGTTPLDRKRLKDTPLLELLRMIREDDTVRPSNRLSTVEELPAIAANRSMEPKKLSGLVRSELDWIAMKALEKDRNRRYETAAAVAADIERYLLDEPVLACPPSAGYRLKKFARRNKRGLTVAAMLLFFLGSGVGWIVGDRVARQGRTGAQVDLILSEVDRLELEQKWPDALVAARRADAAATSGEADKETAQRVHAWLKDLEFIDRLEQLRMERATAVDGEFDSAGADREYARAFREYGVDIDELPVEESIARLKARPAHAVPLAAALDDWRNDRRLVSGRDLSDWKRLVAVARGIDPEPMRDRLRSAWGQYFEAAPAAVPKDNLRHLADTIDIPRQHPATLLSLARTLLQVTKSDVAGLRLLRNARDTYPGDFWLNYELGYELSRKKDHKGAIRYSTAAVSLRPNTVAAHLNLGVALIGSEMPAEAVTCYRKVIELDAGNVKAHNGLAHALFLQKKLDEALVVCHTAIHLDPNYCLSYCNRSLILRGQKKREQAVAAARQAVDIDPKSYSAHMALGDALGDQKKLNEAIACYRRAVELRPSRETYNNLGAWLFRNKQFDEAISVLGKAIELDPESAGPYLNLGNVLAEQKKLDQAVAAYHKALDIEPKHAGVLSNLGYALRRQKPDEAMAYIRKAIALDSTVSNFHYHLGSTLLERKDYAGAVTALREADRLESGNFRYLLNLGHALRDAGRPDEALVAYRHAVQASPDESAGHQFLAEAAQRAGNLDEAVAALRERVRIRPTDPLTHSDLANALRAQGKLDDAIAACRDAVRLEKKTAASPGPTLSQFRLANLLSDRALQLAVGCDPKTRDPKRALDLAQEAVALFPNDAAGQRALGAAHYLAENWKAAIEALEKSRLHADYRTDSLALFFLSMARARTNEKELAGKLFDQAGEWRMGIGATDQELRCLCAEAAVLLGREVPAALKESAKLTPGPKLLGPMSGATLNNGSLDGNKPMVREFDWSDVPGASQYHLYLIGPGAKYPSINLPTLATSEYRHESKAWIANPNRLAWRWKVRALVESVWTEWSEERSFDVAPLEDSNSK